MSSINITCPKCDHQIEAAGTLGGGTLQCPECGKIVLVPMPGIEEGMQIGDFIVEKKLGAGAMGEVWLAHQVSMDRKIALKILSPTLSKNHDFISRFSQEVKTAGKLHHQNIVTAYIAGVEDDIHYLAIEYIEGEELEEKFKRKVKLEEKEALGYIRGIAEALKYAWNKFSILHRDIKPSNIMIDSDGTPKLMDMGISKSLNEQSGLTMTGTVVGTPYYMSPEQGVGDKNIDFHSDLYSLGATLYHLVTGTLPYDADTTMAILSQHITSPFPDPRERDPELSQECVALLEIMMAKKPENRQETWDDLLRDIDLVIDKKMPLTKRPNTGQTMIGEANASERQTSPDAKTMGDRSNKKWWIAGAVGVVVIAGVLLGMFIKPPITASQLPPDLIEVKDAKFADLEGLAPGSQEAQERQKQEVTPSTPLEVKTKNTGIHLRLIPPGTFMMGPKGKQHKVTLTKPFWMGKYEVTQEQYEKVMGNNPSKFKDSGKTAPVENISWLEADEFCKRLMEKESKGMPKGYCFRLPTEAEWEYSCRAGTDTLFSFGSSESKLGDYGWYASNSGEETHPVGQKKPNAWGLYDIHGNVWEWCNDVYGAYSNQTMTNPTGPLSGLYRIHRGGCWRDKTKGCHSYYRVYGHQSGGNYGVGFRIVIAPKFKDGKPVSNSNMTPEELQKALKAVNPDYQMDGKFTVKDGKIVDINLSFKREVKDISPFKGLPIRSLSLMLTKVKNLDPIQGIPLEFLNLHSTPVTDISPLKGMPIKELAISFTGVNDITPLEKMPLEILKLHNCRNIKDLSVVGSIKTLNHITFSPDVENIECLKKLPNLKTINGRTATEFWKEWDAKQSINKGLLAHYAFEDNAKDSSGNGYDGLPIGKIKYVEGMIGKAAEFNGKDTFVDISKLAKKYYESRKNLTVSFFLNINEFPIPNPTSAQCILTLGSKGETLSDNVFNITNEVNSKKKIFQLDTETGKGQNHYLNLQENMVNHLWNHYALVFSDKYVAFYRNGEKISNHIYKATESKTEILNIGALGGECSFLNGIIDDLRIYDRQLSEAEVKALFKLTKSPLMAATELHWKLKEVNPEYGMDSKITVKDGKYYIHLGNQVQDLKPLEGLPIVELGMTAGPRTNSKVLTGMPIRKLNIQYTKFDDYSFIKSLNDLEYLRTGFSNFVDYDLLKDKKKLKQLGIGKTQGIFDARIAMNFPELEELGLPDKTINVPVLKNNPKLKYLYFKEYPHRQYINKYTTDIFWKEWDAKHKAPSLLPSKDFILYGIDQKTKELITIDSISGETSTIDKLDIELPSIYGFDYNPSNGKMYLCFTEGGSRRTIFYTIDPMTGKVSEKNVLNLMARNNDYISMLSFDKDGSSYVMFEHTDITPGKLCSLNFYNSQHKVLGKNSLPSILGGDISPSGDLWVSDEYKGKIYNLFFDSSIKFSPESKIWYYGNSKGNLYDLDLTLTEYLELWLMIIN
jgi:serine/threonine protein kinase/formylglycine-generating enzyme required for sulfatase activity